MNFEMLNWELYSQYAIPAAIGLAALIALYLIVRTIGGKVAGRRGNRLGVSEFHEIDKSRRLVLVRRDDIEHLVMIGGNQDFVIESGIGAEMFDAGARRPAATKTAIKSRAEQESPYAGEQDSSVTPLSARQPKPAIFGDRAPNLRPVERTEPTLPAKDADKSSSNDK